MLRLFHAIERASEIHDGQVRKGTRTPYISHPFAVMALLQQAGESEDVLIAALLHDALEDQPISAEELAEFGRAVRYVEEVTKAPLTTWQERAEDYLARMEHMSKGALAIVAADKLHNLTRSLEDDDWERFSTGLEGQRWWYEQVLIRLQSRMPEHPLVEALAQQVAQLLGGGGKL